MTEPRTIRHGVSRRPSATAPPGPGLAAAFQPGGCTRSLCRDAVAVLEPVHGASDTRGWSARPPRFRDGLGQRTIWNVSSTAVAAGSLRCCKCSWGTSGAWTSGPLDGDRRATRLLRDHQGLHNQIHGQAGRAAEQR